MTNYPPELIEDFRKLVEPRGWLRGVEFDGEHWDSVSVDLAFFAFAHNWHRVRELEEALKDLADEADYIMSTNGQGNMRDLYSFVVDARKLLEKGNE